MASATNRRAVLGAIFATGVAGAVVARPAVAADYPDGELLTLIEQTKAADTLVDQTRDTQEDVWDKIAPWFPQALTWTHADSQSWFYATVGRQVTEDNISALRDWFSLNIKVDLTGKGVPMVFPPPSFDDRARQVVRLWDEYQTAYRAAEQHPDLLAAEAKHDAAVELWEGLAKRVATTRAKTPDGVLAKLAMISSGCDEADFDGDEDSIFSSAAIDARALMKAAREARS